MARNEYPAAVRGKKRFLCIAAFSLLAACASATQGTPDAGADLSVGQCDPKTLFSSCSAQCGEPICIVANATCVGSDWQCDCSQTGPCREMGPTD
jgi:hypothetical protein